MMLEKRFSRDAESRYSSRSDAEGMGDTASSFFDSSGGLDDNIVWEGDNDRIGGDIAESGEDPVDIDCDMGSDR